MTINAADEKRYIPSKKMTLRLEIPKKIYAKDNDAVKIMRKKLLVWRVKQRMSRLQRKQRKKGRKWKIWWRETRNFCLETTDKIVEGIE